MRSAAIFISQDPQSTFSAKPQVTVTGVGNTYYSLPIAGKSWSALVSWTVGPSGTMTLWATTKENPKLTDDTDWVQVTESTLPTISGTAGKALVQLSEGEITWRLARLKYVNSGGSGYLSATVSESD